MSMAEDDLDQRMRGEGAVQVVELLAAGGGDRDGDAQVLAAAAGAQLDAAGVERGIEAVGDVGHGVHEAVLL